MQAISIDNMQTLSREASLWNESEIQRISNELGEPASLLERRLNAFMQFKKTPWPTPLDESWRRNDPRRIGKSRFPLYAISDGNSSYFTQIKDEGLDAIRGTRLIFNNFGIAEKTFAPGQIESGLVVGSLNDDFQKNTAERLEKLTLSSSEDTDSPALSFLHTAFSQGGIYCLVPDNWSSPYPIILSHRLSHSGKALFPKNIINVGRNSRATILLNQNDLSEIESWLGILTQIVLEEGTRLDLIAINRSGTEVNFYEHLQVALAKDAQFNMTWFDDTKGWTVMRREVTLQGKGASARLRGANIGSGNSHYDLRSIQDHTAPSTFSDLMFKAVNFDRSKSVYQGLIKVHEQALNANAYQLNRNLLMSPEARADSIPKLEILVDEVKCTHGASAGKPDPNSMFYLKSRGIPQKEASRLIVEGFLNETGGLIDDSQLREYWHTAVIQNLNSVL